MSDVNPQNPKIKIHLNHDEEIGSRLHEGVLVSSDLNGNTTYFKVKDLNKLVDGNLDTKSKITPDLIQKIEGIAHPIIQHLLEQSAQEVNITYKLEKGQTDWKRHKATQIKDRTTEDIQESSLLKSADKGVNAYSKHMQDHHTVKNLELQKLIEGDDLKKLSSDELKKKLPDIDPRLTPLSEGPYNYLLCHKDMNHTLKEALKDKVYEKVNKQLLKVHQVFIDLKKASSLKLAIEVDEKAIDFCLDQGLLQATDLNAFYEYLALKVHSGKDMQAFLSKLSDSQKQEVKNKKQEIELRLTPSPPPRSAPKGKIKVTKVSSPTSKEQEKIAEYQKAFNAIENKEAIEDFYVNKSKALQDHFRSLHQAIQTKNEVASHLAEIKAILSFLFSQHESAGLSNPAINRLIQDVIVLKYITKGQGFDKDFEEIYKKAESLIFHVDNKGPENLIKIAISKAYTVQHAAGSNLQALKAEIEKGIKSDFMGMVNRKKFMNLIEEKIESPESIHEIFETWQELTKESSEKEQWAPIELALLSLLQGKVIKDTGLEQALLKKKESQVPLYSNCQDETAACLQRFNAKSAVSNPAKKLFDDLSNLGPKNEENRSEKLKEFKKQAQAIAKDIKIEDIKDFTSFEKLPSLLCCLLSEDPEKQEKALKAYRYLARSDDPCLSDSEKGKELYTLAFNLAKYEKMIIEGVENLAEALFETLFEEDNLRHREAQTECMHQAWNEQVKDGSSFVFAKEHIEKFFPALESKSYKVHLAAIRRDVILDELPEDFSEDSIMNELCRSLHKYAEVIFTRDWQKTLWETGEAELEGVASEKKGRKVRFLDQDVSVDTSGTSNADSLLEEQLDYLKEQLNILEETIGSGTDDNELANGIYSTISWCLDRCSQENKSTLDLLEDYCVQLKGYVLSGKLTIENLNHDQLQVLLYAGPDYKPSNANKEKDREERKGAKRQARMKFGTLSNTPYDNLLKPLIDKMLDASDDASKKALIKMCLNRMKKLPITTGVKKGEKIVPPLYKYIIKKIEEKEKKDEKYLTGQVYHDAYKEAGGFDLDITEIISPKFVGKAKVMFIDHQYQKKIECDFQECRFILNHLMEMKENYKVERHISFYKEQLKSHYEVLVSKEIDETSLVKYLTCLHADFKSGVLDFEDYYRFYLHPEETIDKLSDIANVFYEKDKLDNQEENNFKLIKEKFYLAYLNEIIKIKSISSAKKRKTQAGVLIEKLERDKEFIEGSQEIENALKKYLN